jgi:hypothetical protein
MNMKSTPISRRKFIQVIATFTALFSIGGITALFTNSNDSLISGYGSNGYGK